MTNILYISEYADATFVGGQIIQAGMEPAVATQAVTYSTHAESAAFKANTKFVRLHTDGICSVRFGAAPVAVTTDPRLAANQTEFFCVWNGTGGDLKGGNGSPLKVSVVSNT